MTIFDAVKTRLHDDYILGGDVLDDIMKEVRVNNLLVSMQNQWDKQIESYPNSDLLLATVMINVKTVAKEYLEKHHPLFFQIQLLK